VFDYTNTLAYYRIRNVFIIQAPGPNEDSWITPTPPSKHWSQLTLMPLKRLGQIFDNCRISATHISAPKRGKGKLTWPFSAQRRQISAPRLISAPPRLLALCGKQKSVENSHVNLPGPSKKVDSCGRYNYFFQNWMKILFGDEIRIAWMQQTSQIWPTLLFSCSGYPSPLQVM
jgi:hypothetical protein